MDSLRGSSICFGMVLILVLGVPYYLFLISGPWSSSYLPFRRIFLFLNISQFDLRMSDLESTSEIEGSWSLDHESTNFEVPIKVAGVALVSEVLAIIASSQGLADPKGGSLVALAKELPGSSKRKFEGISKHTSFPNLSSP